MPNVHDRHDQPSESDTADEGSASKKSKTTQPVRNAHFLEDGVKVDGTTSKHFDADGNEVKGDD